MILTTEISWPTEAPEADTGDREQFLRATFTTGTPKVTSRNINDARIISYTALLNDYAWWVLLQLVVRRGFLAAGFKTMAQVLEASEGDRKRIEGPWVNEVASKIFNDGRLAGYVNRYHRRDDKVHDEPLFEVVERWERHFRAGLPYVLIGLADLRHVQCAESRQRKRRLEEMRKLMKLEFRALEQQRQLAAELGV